MIIDFIMRHTIYYIQYTKLKLFYKYHTQLRVVRQVKKWKYFEIYLTADLPHEMTVLPPKGQAISRGER